MIIIELQMQKASHDMHSKVTNPTPLQVRSLESSLDYDHGRRIKVTLQTLTCTNDIKKWLQFLRECGISSP